MKDSTAKAKVINIDTVDELIVEKATEDDLNGILKVASSVGNGKSNSKQGFLMDNYSKNTKKYREKFRRDINESDMFYVIKKRDVVLGFLLAYNKKQWLNIEPNWIFDTNWKDDFDKKSLKKFVVLEKIAVRSQLTGKGVGSELFKRFRKDALKSGLKDMFSETILAPRPNFASMEFAMKQNYNLGGVRYEEHNKKILTTIVYHKNF